MLVDALKTVRLIREGLAASRWPVERISRLQEDRLRTLLVHAYRNVPLYHVLYDEAGFQPDEFRSLADLDKIPILTKERLKAASPEEVVARGIDPARCTVVKTSGSTGVPMRIYIGPRDRGWGRGVQLRILFEHGYRWTDRIMEIRMTLGRDSIVRRLGIARRDWVSILEPPEFWARRLAGSRPEIIVAGAGTLQALAEAVEALGVEPTRPRIIIADGETLGPATRNLVRRVIGTDPIDVYGLVELSYFAWECERRCGFHVSADSHIVEIAAPPGRPGPIVATALGRLAMPIIRYDTGDLGELDSGVCPCGRSLPLLRRIHGRAVDSVSLPGGGRLFWPFFHEILGKYQALRQWRVVQDDERRLRMQLAMPLDDAELLARIEADLRSALPVKVDLQIERMDRIPMVPGRRAWFCRG
ncbi:MAG: phenylacetate--CoA ligase family protein [Chromatiales bacterium]